MVMQHELHLCIGKILSKIKKTDLEVKRDKACGGDQYISLFLDSKDRKNAICKVDALLIYKNQIQVIIEIEESGLNPTKICGKYLTSELSEFYERGDDKNIRFAEWPTFIQIVDTKGVNESKFSKKEQVSKIESKILDKCNTGKIKEYRLFCINGKKDRKGIKVFSDSLNNILSKLP